MADTELGPRTRGATTRAAARRLAGADCGAGTAAGAGSRRGRAAVAVLKDETAKHCNIPTATATGTQNKKRDETKARKPSIHKTDSHDDKPNLETSISDCNSTDKGRSNVDNVTTGENKAQDDGKTKLDDRKPVAQPEEPGPEPVLENQAADLPPCFISIQKANINIYETKNDICEVNITVSKGLPENRKTVEKQNPNKNEDDIRKNDSDNKQPKDRTVRVSKEEAKEEFSSLSTEGKILRVRHKLEKIIHGKEKNQNKAVDLLRILEQITITEQDLTKTKIDLTLEALKFIVKDESIIRKTERVLRVLKKLSKKEPAKKITSQDWRETRDFTEVVHGEEAGELAAGEAVKVNVEKTEVHWMDRYMAKLSKNDKAMESLNKQLQTMSNTVQEFKPTRTESDVDTIASSLNNIGIKDKSDKIKKCDKASSVFQEVDLVKEINTMSIKEKIKPVKDEKCTEKLFSDPNKIQTTLKLEGKEPDVKKEKVKVIEDPESLLNRLKRMEVENNLHKIKIKLDEFKPDKEDKEVINKLLSELGKYDVSLEMLEVTKIGISLQKFRKLLANKDLAKIAKEIIKKWKTLLPVDETVKQKKEREEKEKAVREAEKEKKENEEKERREKADKENSDKVRAHCKTLLQAALDDNTSVPPNCRVATKELASAIEEAIFERFRETNQKYRSQVR